MEWRCEWCGKPHEANDPPCDNCGHGSFERAVRPVAPEGEGGPTVWVCTECGNDHPRNNPPCSRCGGMDLERREQSYEDGDPIGPSADVDGDADADEAGGDSAPIGGDEMTVWACTECGRTHPRNNPPCSRCSGMSFEQRVQSFDGDESLDADSFGDSAEGDIVEDGTPGERSDGVAGGSTEVWACAACGRSHTRNNPPCSRCGNMQFERRVMEYDDVSPTAGGWLAAVDAKVLLGFLAAFVLLALVVGTTLGIVTLPGAPKSTVPTDEVPGAAETAHGLDLASVEAAYVETLNERRTAEGLGALSSTDALDRRATWYNRRVVQAEYTDAPAPTEEEVENAFPDTDRCSYKILYSPYQVPDDELAGASPSETDSAEAVGAALVDAYERKFEDYNDVSNGFVGVDVHVGPDDTIYVTQFVC